MSLQRFLLPCLLLAAPVWAQLPSEYDQCPAAVTNAMTELVNTYALPGAQVAVAQNGALRCAGALGYADSAQRRAMRPTSVMRIGSISKTLTGMAILRLMEDGALSLDDPIVGYLSDLLPAGGPPDARWQRVTIRNLMQQSLGWDRAEGGEPIQNSRAISAALGIRGPATSADVARWLFTARLHFEPGTRESYTGVSHALAALIVERRSGMLYEQFVRTRILAPMGIHVSMRIGRTLAEGRSFPDDAARLEVTYEQPQGTAAVPSVFPYVGGTVAVPYGQTYLEAMEGSGGWVANAPALVRFVDRVMGRGGPSIFRPETLREMTAKPSYLPANATVWYGIGWQVIQAQAGLRLRFAGGLPGTTPELYFLPNGNTYAFLTNSSGNNPDFNTLLSNYLLQNLSGLPLIGGNDLYASAKYAETESAAPVIRSQKGVVQGASFERGIVPGSWFTIFGWNLAGTTRLWGDADFSGTRLPTQLDGVEVRIDGRPAAVNYISPTQVNAQVPGGLRAGTATLQVIRNGVPSQPEPIEIRENAPEVFRYFASGRAYAVALHADNTVVGDPAVLAGTRPAQPGQVLVVYGTGFATSADGVIVTSAVPLANVSATIGGQNAPVAYAGLAGAGLFQINLTVPALPPGEHPLRITVQGVPALVPGSVVVR